MADLSGVPTRDLELELSRRHVVPRLAPPVPGQAWVRRPTSTLVDLVAWRTGWGSPGWDRCSVRLLSPVSGVDALELLDGQDVGDVLAGLSRAWPLVRCPGAGWTPVHQGLGARARDEEDRRVFETARALRWPA